MERNVLRSRESIFPDIPRKMNEGCTINKDRLIYLELYNNNTDMHRRRIFHVTHSHAQSSDSAVSQFGCDGCVSLCSTLEKGSIASSIFHDRIYCVHDAGTG